MAASATSGSERTRETTSFATAFVFTTVSRGATQFMNPDDIKDRDKHFAEFAEHRDELLPQIKERQPETPVIMITAYGTVDNVVEAVRAGAENFVQKPWDNEKLMADIRSAVARHRACGKAAGQICL